MTTLRFIDDLYAQYLHNQLGLTDQVRVRVVLQEICKLYRLGYAFKPSILGQIEIVVVGQLNAAFADNKLRRWCLNVLSLIGTTNRCRASIEKVLSTAQNDPDTMSAAMTAYFKISKNAYSELSKRDIISNELVVLAAIKGGFLSQINLNDQRIDIDIADPPVLRSALLGVGLNKLPEHLFHPNYANGVLVGKLSAHDDELVSQYSVWAVAENPNLSANDLTIDFQNLDDYRPNVRGWVYRLFAEETDYSHQKHELITRGSEEDLPEPRRNLAVGLRDTHYDGLEAIVCPWYSEEQDVHIQALLIDHMVKNNERCSAYRDNAIQLFEDNAVGSIQRSRMTAMASGTELFGEFKRIDFTGDGDLFSSPSAILGGTVTNYNIGNIQSGAVSLGGDATNTGTVHNELSIEQVAIIQELISELRAELGKYTIDRSLSKPVNLEIEQATKNPTIGTLKRLSDMLSETSELSNQVKTIGGDASKIIEIGSKIFEMIAPFLG